VASRSLGTLTLDLVARIGGFTRGLDAAERETAKRTAAISKGFQRMGGFVTAAVVATASALAYMVKQTIDAADEIAKTSQAIGVNAQEFQALSYAADLAGVNNEKLEQNLRILARTLNDANKGLKEQKAAFAALGIEVTDSEGNLRDSISVLKDISDVFSTTADGAGKTALAMKLFGKSGADMIPLLNSGRDAIEKLEQQARDLGLVMSDETLRGAEEFNDSLTTLKAVSTGIARQISAEMLPSLNEMTGLMVDVATNTQFAARAADLLSVAWKSLATVGIIAFTTIESLTTKTKAFGKSLLQAATKDVSGAVATVVLEMDNVTASLERLDKLWSGSFSDSGSQATSTLKGLAGALGALNEEELEAQRLLESNAKTIADFVRELEFQVDTAFLYADAVERERLALLGADAATLQRIETLQEQLKDIERSNEAQERFNDLLDKHREALTGVTDEAVEYKETLAELKELLDAAGISQEEYNRAAFQAFVDLPDATEKMKEATEGISKLSLEAAKQMQGHFADFLFDPFEKGLDGLAQSFADTLQRMAAEAAAAKIFEFLFGPDMNGSGFLGSLFGGNRAFGGPVAAGSIYQVGERNRPELFMSGGREYLIPGNSGRVEPVKGGGVTQIFNIKANDPNAFRSSERQIKRQARRGLIA